MAQFDITWIPDLKIVMAEMLGLSEDVQIKSMIEPLKRSIKQVVSPAFIDNFTSGGRPAWEPLSAASTEATGELLVRTGKLKRVAGQQNLWTFNGPEGTATAENLGSAPYGAFHQAGTSKMPARPWAMLTSDDEDKIQQVFGTWLDERIAARGF